MCSFCGKDRAAVELVVGQFQCGGIWQKSDQMWIIPPGYMVLSVACVNIRSSLWLLLNSTSTVPVHVGIWQENVKRVAGGIWKCKGKTCGKTEGWRGRATASTILIINSMKEDHFMFIINVHTPNYCTVMKSSYVYYIIYHNQIDIESISYYLYHLCQSIYINQFMLLQRCTKIAVSPGLWFRALDYLLSPLVATCQKCSHQHNQRINDNFGDNHHTHFSDKIMNN